MYSKRYTLVLLNLLAIINFNTAVFTSTASRRLGPACSLFLCIMSLVPQALAISRTATITPENEHESTTSASASSFHGATPATAAVLNPFTVDATTSQSSSDSDFITLASPTTSSLLLPPTTLAGFTPLDATTTPFSTTPITSPVILTGFPQTPFIPLPNFATTTSSLLDKLLTPMISVLDSTGSISIEATQPTASDSITPIFSAESGVGFASLAVTPSTSGFMSLITTSTPNLLDDFTTTTENAAAAASSSENNASLGLTKSGTLNIRCDINKIIVGTMVVSAATAALVIF